MAFALLLYIICCDYTLNSFVKRSESLFDIHRNLNEFSCPVVGAGSCKRQTARRGALPRAQNSPLGSSEGRGRTEKLAGGQVAAEGTGPRAVLREQEVPQRALATVQPDAAQDSLRLLDNSVG